VKDARAYLLKNEAHEELLVALNDAALLLDTLQGMNKIPPIWEHFRTVQQTTSNEQIWNVLRELQDNCCARVQPALLDMLNWYWQ
jgi:hypothetical protein